MKDKTINGLKTSPELGEKVNSVGEKVNSVGEKVNSVLLKYNSIIGENIVGTKNRILSIDKYKYSEVTIGGQLLLQVRAENYELPIYINPETLEKIELKVLGTNHIILNVNDYGFDKKGKEYMWVLIDNGNSIYINPKTLEELEEIEEI